MKAPTASAVIPFVAWCSCALAAVSFKIIRDPNAPDLRRRSLSAPVVAISESLFNNQSSGAYLAQVSVGTPPQQISLQIDTGSTDVWMLSVSTDLCQMTGGGCLTPFDETASLSSNVVAQGAFVASFGGGESTNGDYITDDFIIGGATIKGLQMGLANTSSMAYGLIGLGYDVNEGSIINGKTSLVYPSIIDEMVSQGLINTRAYSLYLDNLAATTGSIIFGGLDSEKFHGNLVQLPIISTTLANGTTAFTQLQVAMTSVGVDSQSFTPATYQATVVLDSGTTLALLPNDLVAGVVAAVNGVDDTQPENSGFIFVDCNVLSNSSFTVDFGFGGANGIVIHIPASEIVATATTYLGDKTLPVATSSFGEVCLLTLHFTNSTTYLIGDAILRSAYAVYDLQNNLISLAPTNFNSTTSNIVNFTTSETSIPTVTSTASNSTTASAFASATKSTNAGVTSVPAFDMQQLLGFGMSVALVTLGGGMFLAA